MRETAGKAHDRVALKTKSLARNNKTGYASSGNASAPPSYCTLGQTDVIKQNGGYEPRRNCLAFARRVVRRLGVRRSGSCSALMLHSQLNQGQPTAPTMNRDDALLWITLFSFVVLCGLTLWALLRL
jgi:hypothetical protein